MGVTKPYQIETSDGQLIEINLAECVSILRTPDKREEILNGDFHKVAAPNAQDQITIEKPFVYIDIPCNEIILVQLPSQRLSWQEASAELQQIVNQLPNNISPPETRFMRVVFGLGELREKLLTREAGIDDGVLELLKLWLTYEHPIFVEKPGLNLNLDTIDENRLTFIAAHEDDKTSYQLSMPRQVANDLLSQPGKLKQWVSESALPKLFKYAQQVRNQQDIDPNSTDVQTMLKDLPRGNDLPNEAKKALYDLFVWAKDKINKSQLEPEQKKKLYGKLQDKLFEVRFNKQLDEQWHLNDDTEDLDTLWKLLINLPNNHIEGNTYLDEINLDDSNIGYFSEQKIFIGSKRLPNENGFERFEDLVRHEVGHAVEEKLNQEKDNLVSKWLKEKFGWQRFSPDKDSEIDNWVDLMGGYGNITDQQKKEVREYLRLSIGPNGQKWKPPHPPLNAPKNHLWNAPNFGPRLACEQTGENWYQQHHKWYRINDLGFFLNYYFRVFTVVKLDTLKLVEGIKKPYAAMSPFEFFAELYALFYDLDDPQWGNIPRDVCDWLWNNLGAPMPITGKHYRLRNKQSKQVLDVSGASLENGAEVILNTEHYGEGTENNGHNQLWWLEDMEDGYYTLTAKHSEKVLSVQGISIQDGVEIIQDEKNGTDAQQWKLEETEDGYCLLISKVISKVSRMALTISDDLAKNSTLIEEKANQESDSQKWRFELCP